MSAPSGRFRLAYRRRRAAGPSVVLLHGWPGDHTDYRFVLPLLDDDVDVVTPDLRGFGHSDKHLVNPAVDYSAVAQAEGIVALIDELGLHRPVIAGYDIGSRIAQAVATIRPDVVEHLVLSPPLPGVGRRVLDPEIQRAYWYQSFHQLPLASDLIDGRRDAVDAYLRYFWAHWSHPTFTPATADLDALVDRYSAPGAFTASISWYRAGAGTIALSLKEESPQPNDRIDVPASVLWPLNDALFPSEWADRVGEFFTDVTVHTVDGVGHFVPLECPDRFAALIQQAVKR